MWSLRKAFNDIRRRKIRSLLTILGVFIGVAGIVAIVATARNLEQAQRYNFENASQEDMRWWAWNNNDVTEFAIRQLSNVAEVQRRANYYTKFRAGNEWYDVTFYGYANYNDVRVNKMEFVEGRVPQKGEVALDISSLALVNVSIGDEIIYRDGTGREKRLTVVGLARSPAYPSAAILQAAVAYAATADVRTMLGTPNGDNEVLVKLDSLAGRDETRRQIENVFRKRNISFGDVRIRDHDNYLGKSELNTLILMLLFFSTVGLVISGFLVANTLSAIVTEQMGEIGTLKALGGSRWQVLQIYLWAGFIYGAIGSLFGILAGFGLGKLLLGYLGGTVNFDVDRFLFQPEALGLGLLVGVGVTIFAALLPAWNGTRISVRQAIASYGIQSNYGQGRLDKALAKLRHLPPLVGLSLRNLTRRKTRNIITFGVVALSFWQPKAPARRLTGR
jgi:putative ABC transport system permease protein